MLPCCNTPDLGTCSCSMLVQPDTHQTAGYSAQQLIQTLFSMASEASQSSSSC